ncbi:MAG: D-alanyl-D-alanine carboxypeptidase family protein [Verrucomicrobia bacterium]|nr:D-alanyl-D-alanine carboxypeptidase family protein [Verrucomicrobiota bacterium]
MNLAEYEKRVGCILEGLGIPDAAVRERSLVLQAEVQDLISVGMDSRGRDQRLTPCAAGAWKGMQRAALADGVELQLVSAFRSVDYQREIWLRKLAAGQTVAQILSVNAPPGYSEHHTGRAVDITEPGIEPLTEAFEGTQAFGWLRSKAEAFGFGLSFPRGNRFGFVYEPWHWAHSGALPDRSD